MKRLAFIPVLFLAVAAAAQIHGVPASVTSTNGQFVLRAGPPASVTSLGPFGFAPPPCMGVGINAAAPPCVIGPPFGTPVFGPPFRHRHHRRSQFPVVIPVYGGGYYPYADYDTSDYQPPPQPPAPEPVSNAPAPTIFDRNGSGYATSRSAAPPAAEQPMERQYAGTPPEPQELVTLIFRDGHKIEITNYAIVGGTLFDLTPDHLRKKIPLSELDLPATVKANDDRGVEFQLPKHAA